MVDGKDVDVKRSPFRRKLVERFTDIQLCKEFGWTEKEINETSTDFYNDAILITSKKNAKINREYDKQKTSKF